MLKFKIVSKDVLSEMNSFLEFINPEDYEIVSSQESDSFERMKENVSYVGQLASNFSLEFIAPNSAELINLFYHQSIQNMTLACEEYLLHYNAGEEFIIDLKFNATLHEDATNELVEIFELLKQHGVFSFTLRDKKFTKEIISEFLGKNLVHSAPYTHWECLLASQTRIKPSSVYRSVELKNGEYRSLITGIEVSLPHIGDISSSKEVHKYLNTFFKVLNKKKEYTVYIRNLRQIEQLSLPDSNLFKMECLLQKFKTTDCIKHLLTGNSLLTFKYKSHEKWHGELPFSYLEIKGTKTHSGEVYISFEDEEHRDSFLSKFEKDRGWELIFLDSVY